MSFGNQKIEWNQEKLLNGGKWRGVWGDIKFYRVQKLSIVPYNDWAFEDLHKVRI